MSGQALRIKIFDQKGGVQIVPVTKSTVGVGRAPHCDLVLNHSSVSPEHLRAWLEGGRIWIQDMGSLAGTFLNGTALPALKPMLVRDVDVVKLGTCPASLGFEATAVRAPVVRSAPHAPAPTPETTMTEIRPITSARKASEPPPIPPKKPIVSATEPALPADNDKTQVLSLVPRDGLTNADVEKRRVELANVSREFAELKLQLQMARLDKNAGEDLRRQLNVLREEAREVTERKEQTEADIRAMRLAAERETRDQQSATNRKLTHWKVDVVAEIGQRVRALIQQKTEVWATRPLTNEMMLALETEVNQLVRRSVLAEAPTGVTAAPPVKLAPAPTPLPSPVKVGPAPKAETAPVAAIAASEVRTRSHPVAKDAVDEDLEATQIGVSIESLRPKSSLKSFRFPLRGRALAYAIAGFLVVAVTLTFKLAGRSTPADRSTASAVSPKTVGAPPPPTVAPMVKPRQTNNFKESFAENVLFTDSFVEIEANSAYHAQWAAELTKAVSGAWHLSPSAAGILLAKEQSLLQDLDRIRNQGASAPLGQSLLQMRPVEDAFKTEMAAVLGGARGYQSYFALKKANYTRNRAYLKITH